MNARFTANEILGITRAEIVQGKPGEMPGRLVWLLEDITDGDWFVALSSGAVDSHDYLERAMELGAQGCIVNRRARYCFAGDDSVLLAVTDTWTALWELALTWRETAADKVVTITGSEGRRDTVYFLEFLLRRKYRCHVAVEKDGLHCLADLLATPRGTEVLIAEVNGSERGAISKIGTYLKPDLAIVTTTQHPIPSRSRDARAASLNCEILETLSEECSAVIYDRNPAVHERAILLTDGLDTTLFTEEKLNLSKSGLSWLSENSGIKHVDANTEGNAWCALAAAVSLGFSLEDNPHIVSEVIVEAS